MRGSSRGRPRAVPAVRAATRTRSHGLGAGTLDCPQGRAGARGRHRDPQHAGPRLRLHHRRAAGVGGRAEPPGACALGLAVLWCCERLVSRLRLGPHARASPDRTLTDCGLGRVLRPFLALYGGTAHLHGPVSAPPPYCDGRRRHVQCHPADPHVRRFRRHRCQVRRTAGPPSHQPNEARVDAEPVGRGCASRHLPPEGCLRFRMDRKSRSTSSSSFRI